MKANWVVCLLFTLLPVPTLAQETGAAVLVYNLYSSSPTLSLAENTRLTVTNTSDTASVAVHLFFIANDCKIADQFIALTASQTLSFLASDVDPGVRGYLLAVAVDARTGCPIQYNHLIGEAAIKLLSGHRTVLPAEGIQALRDNPTDCDATANAAELKFDGVRYGVLPRVLAADSIPSRLDGNDTRFIINRIGGDLRERAAMTGTLFALLYDDAESAYSFSGSSSCQPQIMLTDSFRAPRFTTVIPQGRTGWFKFYNNQMALPLLGVVVNFSPDQRDKLRSFTGGKNLHHLTNTDTGTLTIPVAPPNG